MANPVLAKNWQFQHNIRVPAQGIASNTNRRVVRTLKNILIGFSYSPWVVVGSSDSTTAGLDGYDRWISDSNIVGATPGSPHSWIVLRQTGIASNYEICIDFPNSNFYTATVAISTSSGFTGGSTTLRPTAIDEQVIISSAVFFGLPGSLPDNDVIINVQQSTDGYCTRAWSFVQAVNTALWIMDKPQSPISGWTNPSITTMLCSTVDRSTLAVLSNTTTPVINSSNAFKAFQQAFTCEGLSTGGLLPSAIRSLNDFDGNYPLFPVGMVCIQTGFRGRHATVFDMWWGCQSVTSGFTYPNDGTRQFVQVANVVFPNNGVAPVII